MQEIQLTQGYTTQVTDARFESLNSLPWHAKIDRYEDGGVMNVYAVHSDTVNGALIYMHRVILGITNPTIKADHKDGNGLNNQDYNLRKASTIENARNQRLMKSNTSGFKGVYWNKAAQMWHSRICVNGVRKHLGLFINPKDAARAYDTAALMYFGEFALTNKKLGLL